MTKRVKFTGQQAKSIEELGNVEPDEIMTLLDSTAAKLLTRDDFVEVPALKPQKPSPKSDAASKLETDESAIKGASKS